MRITGGIWRGRSLSSPLGLKTRPTSDRARQAVFNILNHAGWLKDDILTNAHVMDVFSGTGALGLESLSHGATDCFFIENDRAAQNALRANIDTLGAQDITHIFPRDVFQIKKRPDHMAQRHLIFFDPPYGQDLGIKALAHLDQNDWIADHAVCVMEMSKEATEDIPDGYTLCDTRTYGIALVRFLMRD